MRILIVGLGLIGGSLAKAFKKFTDYDIVGFDKKEDVTKKAIEKGDIDQIFDGNYNGIDIIISGLFPRDTINFVKENEKKIAKNTIVTDCGGVKEKVCNEIEPIARENGFTFIGMHPMAGIEKFGYDNSFADMFLGASLILTPYSDTPYEQVKFLADTVSKAGFSRIKITTPKKHDEVIAYTSQLAHVVSGAYIRSETAKSHVGFSAGSFRDMTRVAHLNENMWTQLFMDNRENLARETDDLIDRLKEYSDALKSGDKEKLFEILKLGREQKDFVDSL
ncbi:MAG: prephenate dehydrogenase [Clostridia bacterium]|nr:prephenate dehydrogenase [Clostridia bacterium]